MKTTESFYSLFNKSEKKTVRTVHRTERAKRVKNIQNNVINHPIKERAIRVTVYQMSPLIYINTIG
jgi:hypothetical protein